VNDNRIVSVETAQYWATFRLKIDVLLLPTFLFVTGSMKVPGV